MTILCGYAVLEYIGFVNDKDTRMNHAPPRLHLLLDWFAKRHLADWWGPFVFIIVVLYRLLKQELDDFFDEDAFVLLLFLFVLCFTPLVQRVFFKTSPLQLHERFALTALSATTVMFWLP